MTTNPSLRFQLSRDLEDLERGEIVQAPEGTASVYLDDKEALVVTREEHLAAADRLWLSSLLARLDLSDILSVDSWISDLEGRMIYRLGL